MELLQSFPPLVWPNSKLLILGSMPGQESLNQQAYYAHPRNQFWPLVCQAFQQSVPNNYAQKIEFLHQHQLALWDVLATCNRPGSLDTHISQPSPNPIDKLLHTHPQLHTIVCNGRAAANYLRRYIHLPATINIHHFPSTSPANASVPLQTKQQHWYSLPQLLQQY